MGLVLTHKRYEGVRLEGKGRCIDLIVSSILPEKDKACLQFYSDTFDGSDRGYITPAELDKVEVSMDDRVNLKRIGLEGIELEIHEKWPDRSSGKEVPQIAIIYTAPEYKITRIRKTREGQHIITIKNRYKRDKR